MNKKSKKNSLKDVKNLSVQTFLERYYGISHEGISSMTHRVASSFFPHLRRTSFEYIQKNPELVSTGKVVLVEDVNHYPAPYFMPDEESLDAYLGSDHREKVIFRLRELFEKVIDCQTDALMIVEGDKDLEEGHLFQPKLVTEDFFAAECLDSIVGSDDIQKGLVLTGDDRVISYYGLIHGDHSYETMSLPPLEGQAVGISRRTDAIGIFYEKGSLGITMDGMSRFLEDVTHLQKVLLDIFPIAVEVPQKVAVEEVEQTYTFSDMSTYELEKLMKVYRASGQMSYYHKVRREILKRTTPSKAHKIEKEKLKIKEMEEGNAYD